MRFDAQGQPLASTLSDYLLPGPTEVPDIRIVHMETPSPYTRFGQKGIGEGGAIAPPAAITNAVNDALAGLGVELLVSPDHAAAHRRGDRGAAPASEGGRRMKPVAFDYARPGIGGGGACGCSPATPSAKVLAGGQTLGPMLNLRLAQPALLVDITRIPELAAVSEDADAVTIGATVTHAAIEDGRVPDPDRRLSRARRARHRLSRGAHARHHRRQPRPCRPGGRLALVPHRARAPRW